MKQLAADVEKSRRAQADLANRTYVLGIKTGGGDFTLRVAGSRLSVEDGLPAKPDFTLVADDPVIFSEWVKDGSLTDAAVEGSLWLPSKDAFQVLPALDRLPRSTRRDLRDRRSSLPVRRGTPRPSWCGSGRSRCGRTSGCVRPLRWLARCGRPLRWRDVSVLAPLVLGPHALRDELDRVACLRACGRGCAGHILASATAANCASERGIPQSIWRRKRRYLDAARPPGVSPPSNVVGSLQSAPR